MSGIDDRNWLIHPSQFKVGAKYFSIADNELRGVNTLIDIRNIDREYSRHSLDGFSLEFSNGSHSYCKLGAHYDNWWRTLVPVDSELIKALYV